jgi:hypothetical protein
VADSEQISQLVTPARTLPASQEVNQTPKEFLSRHLKGDWGDLEDEDKQENELSLKHG